jgi:hypothetical protein
MPKRIFAKIFILSLAGALLCAAPVRAEPDSGDTTGFVTTIDDLPLMPGLETVADKDVLFETPTGRIAETTATGAMAASDVYKFYGRSLPQLGWQKVDQSTWHRAGEQLHIEASAEGDVITVKFSEKPVGAK